MSSKPAATTNVPVKKKWYEDDDLTVTEKDEQFSQGNIGVGFDAIKVKIQDLYEIGILKLFIETEILKSGSGSFEPGFKELYNPQTMTKPFQIGKELLFTSDIEFSEAGFLPGSLQDDRRKYFLNRLDFNNYLLRLPTPISDIETSIKEKTDSNAYKYLQILGSEEQGRIINLCDKFGENYVNKERDNSNAVIKFKKELSDIKLLAVGPTLTQDAKKKLEEAKQKELKKEEDKKIKLETKKINYKAACKILSNEIRRAQYNVTLEESRAASIKDAASLSTTIVDWMKYKQNSPDFFREVLTIFKPVMSKQVQTDKENIGGKVQQVVTKITSLFKPIIESYFYDNLTNVFLPIAPMMPRTDQAFLNNVIVPANRTNDPVNYSWNNINSTLERVTKLTFLNAASKDAADKLYFLSKFMLNFQSDILKVFTFNKKDGGIQDIFEEITRSENATNTSGTVNMLYHNIVYLRVMLDKIIGAIQREYYQPVPPAALNTPILGLDLALQALFLPPAQQLQGFLDKLIALRELVNQLEALVGAFRLTVQRNSYKTILGETSHAAFVESIFTEKVAPISHANRNNKFLVVSDFITDAYDNRPVEITIPDEYYDLATLGNAIEKELCDKCKWKVDANVPNQNRETIWTCMYDENKKMQLKLYFPENELMNINNMNINNIIPNIHDEYPAGFIRPAIPLALPPVVAIPLNLIEANNSFRVSGGDIVGFKNLSIPQGEYRDIQQLLDVMAKTINDFIGKVSIDVTQAYETKMKITLDAATNFVKFEFKSINQNKVNALQAAIANQVAVQANYNLAVGRNKAIIAPSLATANIKVATLSRFANSRNETLIVDLFREELSIILGSTVRLFGPPFIANAYIFNNAGPTAAAPGPSDEITMGFNPAFPEPSKSVTIETRMQISGDEYDASIMFGIPSSVAPAPVGKIVITPEITIRELAFETNSRNKIKVNEVLDDYLGFSQVPVVAPIVALPELKRMSDYGVLNFTGGTGFRVTVFNPAAPVVPPAITTLDAVDLSKIVDKGNNGANGAKLKTEIMEKTGLYINNSLLKAKVPVITYTDILNSLFYRYPCIPSPEMKDMEGNPVFDKAFDKFIEERVNVSKFKDVVWLGKGKDDASETLLLTIRKALDKTLMYDDCDDRRSKLMCDLHYAICGPVFTKTASQQNQNGETDELEMFHQFQLEIKRPNILLPNGGIVNPLYPRPIIKPFTVKGITPYYDAVNKHYKYLIYGHYLDVPTGITTGCVKYYDPGTKIGPQVTSMQLYDILLFTLAPPGPTTVNSVVEVNFNKDNESFIYPVFQIAGVFGIIEQFEGSNIMMFQVNQVNNVLWTPGKMDNGLPFVDNHNVYSVAFFLGAVIQAAVRAEIARMAIPNAVPSNSFDNIWNVTRQQVPPAPAFPPNSTNRIGLLAMGGAFVYNIPLAAALGGEVMFILNMYSKTCPKCIINRIIANDNTYIYLPYLDNAVPPQLVLNEILPLAAVADPRLQISCGAVSINKDVFKITKKIHFYQREYLVEVSSIPAGRPATPRLADIQNKINDLNNMLNQVGAPVGLKRVNPRIVNRMLWIGLKRQCLTAAGALHRDILSCTIIDHLNAPARPDERPVNLPITFQPGDFIEKIKIDINDPEIVTVFGKFTATIQDRANAAIFKTIRNAMVIYTNLENQYNNNRNFGAVATSRIPPPLPPVQYSLEYDNFRPLTIDGLPEFQGYYSCVDGLVVASNHGGGTVQQNMGTLLVKKNQAETPVLIGFHDHKITELTIDKQHSDASDIWSSILCYDYNICADIIQYDETTNPPTTVVDKGLFNPLSFNAFKTTLEDVDVNVAPLGPTAPNPRGPYVYTRNQQRITELFNGEFVLVATKQSRPSNALSKLHVLNTWGVDLSSSYTSFYKRIFEDEGSQFNLKTYEMYINKVVDTILGSATKYYKEKIKNSLLEEEGEYGTITNPNSPPSNIRFRRQGVRNVIVGGGRREDAAAMIVAKNIELEEMKKLQRYKSNEETRQEKSVIEIRVPDIMMSDAYLAELKSGDRTKARKSFFDALYKYSKKLSETAKQENANDSKTLGKQGNVVFEDEYKVVLCSSKLNFDDMYKDKAAGENVVDESFFSVTTELYDYDLNDVKDGIKNIILVNEWNDRGFIGDYGAFAATSSNSNSLTPNQMIISKTVKVNAGAAAVAAVAANQVVEYEPKVPNSSFLMNPFITYGTFDSSKWSGFNSMFDDNKGGNETRMQQVGGTPEDDFRNLQMELIRNRRQQAQYEYSRRGQGQGRLGYGYEDDLFRQRYMEDYNDDGEILKVHRRAFEKTNISSTQLKEVSIQATMRTDTKLKRVVLWLCDFREGKMLMVKTHIGPNVVVLSLPSQQQFAGGNEISGYALLQQLCKRYFKRDLRKWTPEYAYIHSSGTGVFIYSAKSNELPKETMDTAFVQMKIVFNMVTQVKERASHISISNSDKSIIEEIFRVVALIQGGLISSTSKEFNDIVAKLVSRTVPPHLRSVISQSKRTANIEANVNFLIKLFFPPNNLFFARGNAPYYIYSSQRNRKIYTIVKQETYDDDSYLTSLKLFLQTQADFKSKDKDKMNNFRVGCAVKKKLITDNFSAVWDNFWGDLIESEEQGKFDDQLEIDVEGKEGVAEGEGKAADKEGEGKDDDKESPTVCLELAKQSGARMYSLQDDWNVSNYWPIKYNGVYYNIRVNNIRGNIRVNEKYMFNNEYFYDLDRTQLTRHQRVVANDSYLGFKCMAYYKNGNNPILFLGDMGQTALPGQPGRVYKLELNTHKLTKFIETDANRIVLCMDILDIEGEDGYMLIGGNFTQITTFRYDSVTNNVVAVQPLAVPVTVCAAMINLNTYEVIKLFSEAPGVLAPFLFAAGTDMVQKVCICQTKKIVKAKGGAQAENIEGYVALIGGSFTINVTNDNNPLAPPAPLNNREEIINIGCVLIRKNPNNPNMEARLVAVDSNVALTAGIRSGIYSNNMANFKVTSIVCQEKENEDNKSETTFFIGGRFKRYTAIDYVPLVRPPANTLNCNGIIKLTLKCEYDKDNLTSKYNQTSVIEPIRVNAAGNADKIVYASLQYGIINSKMYLYCLTSFLNPAGLNVYTRLNIFDVESKLNVIQTPDILVPPPALVNIPNYNSQTLLLTKDDSDGNNVQNVLIMSITTGQNPPFLNYTFTCNVSSLSQNAGAAAAIQVFPAASNGNANVGKNNIITDMFYMKDTRQVFIAHQNVLIANPTRTEYPLTVRSNYQALGEWKLESKSKDADDEIVKFDNFIDKVIEMRKIFKLNPSMVLFLQDVDVRYYNDIDSKITKTRLEKMSNDLIVSAADVLARGAAVLPPIQATIDAAQAAAAVLAAAGGPPVPTAVAQAAVVLAVAPLVQAAAAAAVIAAVAGGAPAAVLQAALEAAQAVGGAATTINIIAAGAAEAARVYVAAGLAALPAGDRVAAVIAAVQAVPPASTQAVVAAAATTAGIVPAAAAATIMALHTPGIVRTVAAAVITVVVIKQNQLILDSPCNDVDKKIKNIMEFAYVLKTPSENLIEPAAVGVIRVSAMITDKIYNFINDLLFMLVYTGCNDLAELICNNYVNLVIMPQPLIDTTTWRTQFDTIIGGGNNTPIGQFIEKIAKKAKLYKEKTRITPDISYDFKICSDPDTHTGVAYLVYNYNQNLNSLITTKSQDNLENKIYEYGKDDFFDTNDQFYVDYITDNIGNTRKKIKFCSFYKFDRRTMGAPPNPLNDIGNADSETVYASVNISGDGINSGKVFEFLDVIRKYFVSLRSGTVIVDIGISGPIKRLIIGGDFGCNLLHDVEVCRKFKSKQMKIYTRRDNENAFNDSEGTNHVFMIDVDLEPVLQVGGNNNNRDNNNQNNQKRICIGEQIEENHRVLSNKRKTRRKVHLMLSSS